jgi:hypothetical protein
MKNRKEDGSTSSQPPFTGRGFTSFPCSHFFKNTISWYENPWDFHELSMPQGGIALSVEILSPSFVSGKTCSSRKPPQKRDACRAARRAGGYIRRFENFSLHY